MFRKTPVIPGFLQTLSSSATAIIVLLARYSRPFIMSFITRRGISTLIPPKVASPSGIGAAKDAARMERVSDFYARLPRGAAPEPKPTGLFAKYQAKHFGKNPTAKPIVHLIIALGLMGYTIQYVTHLRHHKNNAH